MKSCLCTSQRNAVGGTETSSIHCPPLVEAELKTQYTAYNNTPTTMATEECESAILAFLSTDESVCIEDTHPWAEENQLDPLVVLGAVHSLLAEGYVTVTDRATSFYALAAAEEAQSIVEHGSQEMIVLRAIQETGGKRSLSELEAVVGKDVCKIGLGNSSHQRPGSDSHHHAQPARTPQRDDPTDADRVDRGSGGG